MTRPTPSALSKAKEIDLEFYRSSGPGGQNVDKLSTGVRLRFDVRRSRLLDVETKERLVRLAGSRLTQAGVLVIEAQRYRTQERNRKDAVERLMGMIAKAAKRPKRRRATKPTAGSRERRLEAKKRKTETKRGRRTSKHIEG